VSRTSEEDHEDDAAAVFAEEGFTYWNFRFVNPVTKARIGEMELKAMPARMLFELIMSRLSKSAVTPTGNYLSRLKAFEGSLKLTVTHGENAAYEGWKKVEESMRRKLQ
jgi:hypothetical protein